MAGLRYRPNGVCACVLSDVPGDFVYIKGVARRGEPLANHPARWLGFVCLCRARKLPYARKGKLIATAVTNGDVVGSEWRDLKNTDYVLGMLVQLGQPHEIGAWGVLDEKGWPIVLSEGGPPRLTIISNERTASVKPLLQSARKSFG